MKNTTSKTRTDVNPCSIAGLRHENEDGQPTEAQKPNVEMIGTRKLINNNKIALNVESNDEDKAFIESLYNDHYDELYAYAKRKFPSKNHQDAEDLVHDVFEHLLTNSAKILPNLENS